MKTYEKYINETSYNFIHKIKECVNDIKKKYKNSKVLSYEDILEVAQKHGLYKDDLPDLQEQLEDVEGFEIDYDN